MTAAFDPWRLLGVTPEADRDEVRAAWRRLAAEHHPDRYVDGTAAERAEAADRMTVINAAYEEIRSGRAVPPVTASNAGRPPPAAPPGGAAPAAPTWDVDEVDEILATAQRILRQRDRRRGVRRSLRVGGALLGLAVVALALHLYLSQDYGYDLVVDRQGNQYHDVDCGNRYERGTPAATALRGDAVTSLGAADLRHQADVVEEVCGRWTRDLWLLWFAAVPVGAYGLWLLVGRRARW